MTNQGTFREILQHLPVGRPKQQYWIKQVEGGLSLGIPYHIIGVVFFAFLEGC